MARIPDHCETCAGIPPLCDACVANRLRTLGGVAWVRGRLWGESLNRLMPRPLAPWPAYDSDRAVRVRAICRRKVEQLAGTAAGPDERTRDALARQCAAGAELGYLKGPVRAGGVSFFVGDRR